MRRQVRECRKRNAAQLKWAAQRGTALIWPCFKWMNLCMCMCVCLKFSFLWTSFCCLHMTSQIFKKDEKKIMNTSLFGTYVVVVVFVVVVHSRKDSRKQSKKNERKEEKTQIIQANTHRANERANKSIRLWRVFEFLFPYFEMANGIRIETGILQLISISKNKRIKLTVNWKLGQ